MKLENLIGKIVTIHFHDRTLDPQILSRRELKVARRKAYGTIIPVHFEDFEEEQKKHAGKRVTFFVYGTDMPLREPKEDPPEWIDGWLKTVDRRIDAVTILHNSEHPIFPPGSTLFIFHRNVLDYPVESPIVEDGGMSRQEDGWILSQFIMPHQFISELVEGAEVAWYVNRSGKTWDERQFEDFKALPLRDVPQEKTHVTTGETEPISGEKAVTTGPVAPEARAYTDTREVAHGIVTPTEDPFADALASEAAEPVPEPTIVEPGEIEPVKVEQPPKPKPKKKAAKKSTKRTAKKKTAKKGGAS